jgi:formate dehydrogenase (NADP+) beta subunit
MIPNDLTPPVDLLAELGTGPLRYRRPVYANMLPPCNNACPAGENIQGWLEHAQAGRAREAWSTLTQDNPLPAVCGRVCFHPCESSCNRAALDSSIAIHSVERFLGDLATSEGWSYSAGRASGKRVLIVGAGPCGVSAGYHLARMGHNVEVRDAGKEPGGMLHFGIPAYRMPRVDLASEIARIEAMGVAFVSNHAVSDLLAEKEAGSFDAVLVAVGAQLDQRIEIPSCDAARVLAALPLLRDIEDRRRPQLGRRVIVYGAGDTAMDVARSARRLGADEPLIVYHRDRAHMKAHDAELEAALAEGVKVRWLSGLSSIAAGEVVVEEMALDASGIPHPTGRIERLAADTVILAIGERADTNFLRGISGLEIGSDGSILVDQNLMTGHAGIFAGGDATPNERSVSIAIGHGKRAARAIDRWLCNEAAPQKVRREIVTFDMLHLPIYSSVPAQREQVLPPQTRVESFEEIALGLTAAQAQAEARRCLSCGNCYECDLCYASCPEQAIVKAGPGLGYGIDDARCTGCAVCFETCPCHAISMIEESRGMR